MVIGDSHSVIWGGRLVLSDKDHRSLFPRVSTRHLGEALAYNLIDDSGGTVVPGKWGKEVLRVLNRTEGISAVCLCFGEIDVRTRAVKVAVEKKIPLTASVEAIASRLVAFCEILRAEFRQPIFVAAPVPYASQGKAWDGIYPAFGSERERNWASRLFTDYLFAKQRELRSFHVVSILDQLLDCSLRTRSELYSDEIHLGTRGLDLLVGEVRRIIREQNLPLPDFWDASQIVADTPAVRDISREVTVTIDALEQTTSLMIDIGYAGFPRRLKLLGLKFDTPRLRFTISSGMKASGLVTLGKAEPIPSSGNPVDFGIELPPSLSCRFLRLADETSAPFSFQGLTLEAESLLKR